jgi:intein/homing endonuclease
VQSCFAPGTKVWTQTGRTAIEKIKVGDRVLAQDVDTGELAYKPVLGVSIRPPQERLKIGVGADSFVATPGHPFWVDGKGWQLAKQLEVGQILHGVAGGTPVESIEALETDPTSDGYSYNLYVADFESYFVGEHGILVHDNDPRQPTASIVPGLTAEATAATAAASER